MILEDAKEHLQELLRVCQGKADLDKDYLRKVVQFCEEFKSWTPEAFVFIEGGVLQGASANSDVYLNLFDADNEKDEAIDEGGLTYEERLKEWNANINKGHENGSLKPIF